MQKSFYFQILLLFLSSLVVNSQSSAITIDGIFDDWTSNVTTYTDLPETINGVDLLEIQITNDNEFLFLKIKTNTEFDLTDDTTTQSLALFIDTDNDPSTGFNIQTNYGSEIGILFNQYLAHYNVTPYSQLSFSDFSFRMAPTVSSNEFEIAIKRNAIPDGINPLFNSNTIRILLKNNENSDKIPEIGNVISYTFDNTPTTPLVPTEINIADSNLIRIMAYNTLQDGLISSRVNHFETIFTLLNPDIISLEECYNTSINQVKTLFDTWLPTGTSNGWHVDKKDGNIVVSRWEILQNWHHLTRQFPVLINLPAQYNTNLLFTASHLKCCGNGDPQRQDQADQYAAFILDAKTAGGSIDLPQNTPFVYVGDLNLVGSSAPLTTLITGNIFDTNSYGNGAPLDWDNTNLTEQNSIQTDNPMAYTWRQDTTQYPPGKLDFTIFSDAVLNAEKSFVLQTEVMPLNRLQQYGLDEFETSNASDHFPIVTDFSIDLTTVNIRSVSLENSIDIYPNPTSKSLTISVSNNEIVTIKIIDIYGKLIFSNQNISTSTIDLSQFSNGIYYLSAKNNDGVIFWHSIIKQ